MISQEATRPGFIHVGLTCLFLHCLFFIVHNVLVVVIVLSACVSQLQNIAADQDKIKNNVDGQFDTKVPGTYVLDIV